VVRGLLNLVPADICQHVQPSRYEGQERGCLGIGLGPIAGVGEFARDPGKGVDQSEDRETAALPGNLQGLLRELLGDASLVEDLQDLVGVIAELLPHRLPDHVDEPVAPGVAFLHQALDEPADLAQRIVDIGRVLATELDDLGRVPDDVILADRLKPECLRADRPLADLRVPDEETRSEGLALDLGPSGRVDQEAEHVLLAAIQTRRRRGLGIRNERDVVVGDLRLVSADVGRLWRHEVRRELANHREQVGVVQPGVARPVNRPHGLTCGEGLQRLRALGQRLTEHTADRVRRELVERVLADVGQLAQLRKAPVGQTEGTVLAHGQREPMLGWPADQDLGRMPPLDRFFLLVLTMLPELDKRSEPLIGCPTKQLIVVTVHGPAGISEGIG